MARDREDERAAATMARRLDNFPENEVNTALSFFEHVKDRFASDPAVYKELLRILKDFKTGENPDHHKVTADAYALLHGHPDLVRRLDAFFPEEYTPEPAHQDPARTRPKRERRPTAADAAVDDVAGIRRALMYFERVKEAGLYLYDKLLALISHAETEPDVNEIYKGALEIFGSAHSDLLRGFTEYLPILTRRERDRFLGRRVKKEPPQEEHHAPPPKRKATAAIVSNNPITAKKPRADDRKTTNRRAHSPAVVETAPKSVEVSAFREAWEFETTYTKLVVTARRIKELLKAYEPSEDAPPPPPPRGRRAFEDLFPSRECQEVLREMYHGMLGPIREALEDAARTELALRTIKRRLGMLEQVAVKMAMERRDRARVEGRMQKLAVDRVLVLKNQAKQSACT